MVRTTRVRGKLVSRRRQIRRIIGVTMFLAVVVSGVTGAAYSGERNAEPEVKVAQVPEKKAPQEPKKKVVSEAEKRKAVDDLNDIRASLAKRESDFQSLIEEFNQLKKRLGEYRTLTDVANVLKNLSEQARLTKEASRDLLALVNKIEYGSVDEGDDLMKYSQSLDTLIVHCRNKLEKETEKDFRENYENMIRIYENLLETANSRLTKNLDRSKTIDPVKKRLQKTIEHMADLENLAKGGAATIERDSESLEKLRDQVLRSTVSVNENLKTLADVLEKGVDKNGLKAIAESAPVK